MNQNSFSQWSLSRKLLTGFGIILATVGLATVWINYRLIQLELEQQVKQRAQSLSQSLEFATEGLLESGYSDSFKRIVQNYGTLPAVVEVAIISPNGWSLARSTGLIQEEIPYILIYPDLTSAIEQATETGKEVCLEIVVNDKPVLAHILPFGNPHLFGLSGKRGLVVVMVDLNQIKQEAGQAFFSAILTMAIATFVVMILMGILIRNIVLQPLKRLNEAVSNSQKTGTFVLPQALEAQEFAFLAQTFAEAFEQLEAYEQLQQTQTALHQKNQQLTDALQQLQLTQTELIQSEKMAALGELIAGIAHEINTPLGAISASIGNIANAFEKALQQLTQIYQTLSPKELSHFFAFLEIARSRQTFLSFREERQLKRQLQAQLTEKNISNSRLLADILSRMGYQQSLDPWLSLLQHPHNTLILETAYALSIIQTHIENITIAVERAAKIVLALKSYAHRRQSDEKVLTMVSDTIDVVLMLYHNQLKRDIDVTKQYEPVPALLCYPEELSQVWTNLIHNAIQAMEYKGKLEIQVSQQDNYIAVAITDSGVGISPEIQAKIFDPFFTTKPAGKGTGLGLDIVRRIVNKHQGKIEVESFSGHTTFRILLPTNL